MHPKTEQNKKRNTLILAAVILGIALLLCVPRLIAGSRVPENTLEVVVAVDGEEADCPDRRCTRMGPISEPGEWMVCLPHRVTVTIR